MRDRSRRDRGFLVGLALVLGIAGMVGVVGAQTAQAPAETTAFVPLAPSRVLDTRDGTGGRLGPLGEHVLQVAGVGEVPADARAVVLNVTVEGATDRSFLTVQPAGEPPKMVSNLNFGPGATLANAVTVKVGAGGGVSLRNAVGTVEVIADIAGYYVAGGAGPKGEDAAAPLFTTELVDDVVIGGDGPTVVSTLALAEGTYLLEASLQLNASAPARMDCTVGNRTMTIPVSAPLNMEQLVGNFVMAVDGIVSVMCTSADIGEDITIHSIVFSARRADAQVT